MVATTNHALAVSTIYASANTFTVTLSQPAQAGEVILCGVAVNKDAGGTINAAIAQADGSGSYAPTKHHENLGASISGAVWSAVAAGGERRVTFSWPTGTAAVGAVAVYPAGAVVGSAASTDTNTSTTTVTVPAVTQGASDGVAWTFCGIDTGTSWTTKPTVTSGYATPEVAISPEDTAAGFTDKALASGASTGATTWTAPSPDQMWAATLVVTFGGTEPEPEPAPGDFEIVRSSGGVLTRYEAVRSIGGTVTRLEPVVGTVTPEPTPDPDPDELPATYSLTGLPRRVFTTGGHDFWYKPLPTSAPLDPQSANKVNFLIQTGITSWGSPAMGYPSWAMNYATNSPSVLVIKPGQATLPLVLRDPPGGPFGANLVNMFSDAKVPADAVIQAGGTDGFVCIYEIATDTYWEGWQIKWNAPGYPGWSVYRGQRLQNASTKLGRAEPYPNGSNPPFYYGTNAAGLAQEPGVIKVQELQEGHISHALSMAIPVACVAARDIPTPNAGISQPAVRSDGQSTEPYAIHMGQRLRLPASLDLDALDLHPVCRTIAKAFQAYGCYIVDRAGDCSFAAENQSDLPAGIYAPLMQGAQIHDVCWDPPKPGGGKYQPFPWAQLQLLRFETSLDGLP